MGAVGMFELFFLVLCTNALTSFSNLSCPDFNFVLVLNIKYINDRRINNVLPLRATNTEIARKSLSYDV